MHICSLINLGELVAFTGNGHFISLSFLQAEELDLPEILKKKEEIAETRNALFQEISHEKKQYVCVKRSFIFLDTGFRF